MFSAGETIGKYKILREVGRGGMGAVFLAEDVSLGRRVALKVLHGALGGDADFVERFRREARAVAGLYHPNILRVHTLEELNGRWAIETEYVEAGSLADAMAGRGVSAFEAARLVHEVLGALARCHEAGIVHRDVKPSNILIGAEGQALLADFGLAKALAEASEESVAARRSSALFVGTPCYAPLEAWEGGAPSQSWDIYAAGMVLYEVLTGVMPFDGSNVLAVMKQKANMTSLPVRDLAPHVSEALDALVTQMIASDPKDRPADADAARGALERVPELATPTPINRRTVTVARRPSQRLSTSLRKVQRSWVRNAPWLAGASLAALALALPLLWWAVSAGMLGEGQPKRSGPPPFAPVAAVLAEPGPGSDGIVMDVLEHESGTKTDAAWWIGPETEAGTRELIAQGPMTLWQGTLSEQGGVARVAGGWGGYIDVEGLVMRYGDFSGTGSWGKAGEDLSLTITFQSERSGTAETFTFSGTKRDTKGAARLYFYEAERQPGLSRLLVGELLPRKLAWALVVERRLPGLWHERVAVAYEPDAATAAIDGKLEETFWSKRYVVEGDDAGVLPGRTESGTADMLVRHDGKQLLFGLRTSQRMSGRARVTLVFLPRFDMPLEKSPVLSTVWLGGQLVDTKAQYAEDGLAPVKFVEGPTGNATGWSAEGAITFQEKTCTAVPGVGARWRITIHVDDVQADGKARPIVVWGSPEVGDVIHGAVLSFARNGQAPGA